MTKDITQFAKKFKSDYETRWMRIDGQDVFNMNDTMNLVRLYLNNKTRDGQMKYFFNITQQIINNAKKAEDIDTKDMIIVSDSPNYFWQSLLLRGQNRKWMKMVDFGTTLNRMTEVRNTFGGVLVKKATKKVNGQNVADIQVMQWSDAYFDPNDLTSGTKMFLMDYPEYEIRPLLNEKQKEEWDKAPEDERKCYMVYGYLPKEYIDDSLTNDYVYQWHKIVQIEDKMYAIDQSIMDRDIFRYKQYQPRYGFSNPYNIMGKGTVETALMAQMMSNLMLNKQVDILEVAGNVLLRTEQGANANAMQGSTMFELQNGSQLPEGVSPVELMPASAFNGMTNFMQGIRQDMKDATSSQDVVSGAMPPSGTPLGSVQIVNSEARGFYDYMREEMGLFINELYRDWILPDLGKQLKGNESVILEYNPEELLKIDQRLVEQQSSKMLVKAFDEGKAPANIEELQFLQQQAAQIVRADGNEKGNMREMVVKDLGIDEAEYRTQVMVTNEQRNTQARVQTANTIGMGLIQAQGNPEATKMYRQMADEVGFNLTDVQ